MIDTRLRALLDNLPALVGYWDRQLCNQYANKAYVEWFGFEPSEIRGRHISEVLGAQLFHHNEPYIEGALQGQPQCFDRVLMDASGVKRHTQFHYVPDIQNGEVKGFFVSCSDISDLKRIRDELNDAQLMGKLGSWSWDTLTDYTIWSPQLYRMLGRDPALPAPRHGELARYLTPDSWRICKDVMREAMRLGTPCSAELEFIHEDGTHGWMLGHALPVKNASGEMIKVRGTAQDVTERKRIESELLASRNKLRDMVAHHEIACEEERKHVAREVHDELGQLLTAMRMDLALLKTRCGQDEDVQRITADMGTLLDRMFKTARGVVTSLRPAALDAGLVPALEWLAQDFSERSGVACHVDTGGEDLPLRDTLAAVVFRVIQESLTNVARHADATQVSINLRHTPETLSVRVQDDGKGFDIEASHQQTGYGLLSIRERTLSLGGQVSITSTPGRGTVVLIEVPI